MERSIILHDKINSDKISFIGINEKLDKIIKSYLNIKIDGIEYNLQLVRSIICGINACIFFEKNTFLILKRIKNDVLYELYLNCENDDIKVYSYSQKGYIDNNLINNYNTDNYYKHFLIYDIIILARMELPKMNYMLK